MRNKILERHENLEAVSASETGLARHLHSIIGLRRPPFILEICFDGIAGRPKIATRDAIMVTNPVTVVTIKPLLE